MRQFLLFSGTVISIVILLFSGKLNAQHIFQKDYMLNNGGYCSGSDMANKSISNKLIVGSEFVTLSEKRLLINEIDSLGNTIWSKSYSCDSFASWEASKILYLNDSTYIITSLIRTITGMTYDYYSVAILAIDESGNIKWVNYLKDSTFVNQYYLTDIFCLNNSCYAVGSTNMNFNFTSNSDTTNQGLLVNFDINGNINWAKKYGRYGTVINEFSPADSGFVLVGDEEYLDSTAIYHNLIYFKINNYGSVLWSYSWNREGSLDQILNDGTNFILGGYFFTLSNMDAFLFEIDSLGNLIWSKKYGNLSTGADRIKSLIKVEPNKLAISSGFHNFTIMDSLGANPIMHNVSNYNFGKCNQIYLENDGGISGIGFTANLGKIHIFKTDSNYFNCTNYIFNYPVSALNMITVPDSVESVIIDIETLFVQSNEFNWIVSDSTLCETATGLNQIPMPGYDLSVQPNPCFSYLEINLKDFNWNANTIEIFDWKGCLVTKITGKSIIERIDVLNFNSGIYTLVYNDNQHHIVRKFMKL